MATHKLKIWSEYLNLILKGEKQFEVRKNDRNFKVGDSLILQEWNPATGEYTGSHIHRTVTYILKQGNPFIELGEFVIMSIK